MHTFSRKIIDRSKIIFSGAICSLLLASCIVKSDRPVVFTETTVSGPELDTFTDIISDRNGRTVKLTEEEGELFVYFCKASHQDAEQTAVANGQVSISKIPQQNNLYVASLQQDVDLSDTGGSGAHEFYLVRLSADKFYIWSVDPESYPAYNFFSDSPPLVGSTTNAIMYPAEAIKSFLVQYSDEYTVANQPYVLQTNPFDRLSC